MLTVSRMRIAREVLKAMVDVNMDFIGDHMARGEVDMATKCAIEVATLKGAIKALDGYAIEDEHFEVPNFLRRQAE